MTKKGNYSELFSGKLTLKKQIFIFGNNICLSQIHLEKNPHFLQNVLILCWTDATIEGSECLVIFICRK